MSKIYIVGYNYTNYEGEEIIFCTTSKSKADKWRRKFNRILKKWREYYSQYEEKQGSLNWIKDEYVETKFGRWHKLHDIYEAFAWEVELR